MKIQLLLHILISLLILALSPARFVGHGKGSKIGATSLRAFRQATSQANGLEKKLLLHACQAVSGIVGKLIPILILFLNKAAAEASPLNKQVVPLSGPFFQGWLLRSVDHQKGVSIIFIVGSFSRSGFKIFSQ